MLLSGNKQLEHLVIGGGDILRTDFLTLASHYASLVETKTSVDNRDNLLLKIRRKLFGSTKDRKQTFVDEHMNYGAVGPFLLDQSHYSSVKSLGYFSAGVPFNFQDAEKSAVRSALESARYIYVRDNQSRRKLLETGIEKPIDVAPDAVVTLSDFFEYDKEKEKGRSILWQNGISSDDGIVCVQSTYQPPHIEEELVRALLEIKKTTGKSIVLMPIGLCHNDDLFLKGLAEKTSGCCTYIDVHSIFEMISIIASSSLFVGTSMHGNITSFSYGIPHVFGPIAVDKVEGFLDIVGLGPELKLNSWLELKNKLELLDSVDSNYFKLRAEKAKNKIYEIMHKINDLLTP